MKLVKFIRKTRVSFLLAAALLISFSVKAQVSCADLFAFSTTTPDQPQTDRETGAVLNHLQENILQFHATSGFGSNEQIIEAALKSRGEMRPFYLRALHILKAESIDVVIRLPYRNRLKIAHDGFLNSWQSNESQGSVIGRDHIESSYASMSADEWRHLPNHLKPKYAAAYPKSELNLDSPTSLESYTGSDKYYFKLDRVRDRMTATPGDSLNRYAYWHGTDFFSEKPAVSWDQLFIPWNQRFLLIPSVAEGLTHGRLGFMELPKATKWMKPSEYGYQNPFKGTSSLSAYQMKWPPNMDYIELQIWGTLTLDDVEIFEYKTAAPSGKFLAELQKRNIKIQQSKK